ncbi:hypothetical protein X975_12785, partial [Stegodyphus mimosarum]
MSDESKCCVVKSNGGALQKECCKVTVNCSCPCSKADDQHNCTTSVACDSDGKAEQVVECCCCTLAVNCAVKCPPADGKADAQSDENEKVCQVTVRCKAKKSEDCCCTVTLTC